MSLAQAIALGIPGAVFGWLAAHIAFAPSGYQDAAGFHRGSPTTDDRQHGEGERVRGSDQHHSGVNSHG